MNQGFSECIIQIRKTYIYLYDVILLDEKWFPEQFAPVDSLHICLHLHSGAGEGPGVSRGIFGGIAGREGGA